MTENSTEHPSLCPLAMMTIHVDFLVHSCAGDRLNSGTVVDIPLAAQGWGVWRLVGAS